MESHFAWNTSRWLLTYSSWGMIWQYCGYTMCRTAPEWGMPIDPWHKEWRVWWQNLRVIIWMHISEYYQWTNSYCNELIYWFMGDGWWWQGSEWPDSMLSTMLKFSFSFIQWQSFLICHMTENCIDLMHSQQDCLLFEWLLCKDEKWFCVDAQLLLFSLFLMYYKEDWRMMIG